MNNAENLFLWFCNTRELFFLGQCLAGSLMKKYYKDETFIPSRSRLYCSSAVSKICTKVIANYNAYFNENIKLNHSERDVLAGMITDKILDFYNDNK